MTAFIDQYLRERQCVGLEDKDLRRDLESYGHFLRARDLTHISRDSALAWVAMRESPLRRATLLSAIKGMSEYLRAEDPEHEQIPASLIGPLKGPKLVPFIYEEAEVKEILRGFYKLKYHDQFDAVTYHHIIGLISVTGMRVSEAVNLRRNDLTRERLFIKRGKFQRDRRIFVDRSTAMTLESYFDGRPDRYKCDDLFSIHTGRKPSVQTVQHHFRRCIDQIGLRGRGGSGCPRIHDFRHTFAVRHLSKCDFDKESVTEQALALSTHLGHVKLESTFWYLDISSDAKKKMSEAFMARSSV